MSTGHRPMRCLVLMLHPQSSRQITTASELACSWLRPVLGAAVDCVCNKDEQPEQTLVGLLQQGRVLDPSSHAALSHGYQHQEPCLAAAVQPVSVLAAHPSLQTQSTAAPVVASAVKSRHGLVCLRK